MVFPWFSYGFPNNRGYIWFSIQVLQPPIRADLTDLTPQKGHVLLPPHLRVLQAPCPNVAQQLYVAFSFVG